MTLADLRALHVNRNGRRRRAIALLYGLRRNARLDDILTAANAGEPPPQEPPPGQGGEGN